MAKMTQQQLETHLWGAAKILRGKTAGQDYKTYILTLMFFKRLSDQWDYEADEIIAKQEKEAGVKLNEGQRRAVLKSSHAHRFTIPPGCHWADVLAVSENIGEALTKATKQGIGPANKDLVGVFTVDWNQPAPDGNDKLIPNAVVHALVQHFNGIPLSNAHVEPDILGRSYEYLIKMFADDAGAKAGEFFTPPEVVDILIRCLEPQPGETVYDPTCGSGGMLVHSADFLIEQGHRPEEIRYRGQEMNWSTYAIAKINMILHGLEADIKGGKSTLTDPQFLKTDGSIEQFDVVIANFPFSDDEWWLREDQRTEDAKKKAKKGQGKEGFKDPFNRMVYGKPPASDGDFAYIQHILASANDEGRCGVVCKQGVLFGGQPKIEEETGEFDDDGHPKMRRRKPDDEYLIRKGMLDSRLIEAVIGLPLDIFYGAGLPACLLILKKKRSQSRRDKVLIIHAARHFRELATSNKNQLRPQDVMRILVHYHAFGDAKKAAHLVKQHSARLHNLVSRQEAEDIARLIAEYQEFEQKSEQLRADALAVEGRLDQAKTKTEREKLQRLRSKSEKEREKPQAKLAQRDALIEDVRRIAESDRQDIHAVGEELVSVYGDPSELVKHVKLVDIAEVEENEQNLNIARYVDTFDPQNEITVNDVLTRLEEAEAEYNEARRTLLPLLQDLGYVANTALTQGLNHHRSLRKSEVGLIPDSWQVIKVGDALIEAQYGLSMAMSKKGQYPILRMAAIQNGDVLLGDLKYVDLPEQVASAYLLSRGDILFNRTNSADLVGKVGVFRSDAVAVFASYLIRLKTRSDVVDNYFFGQLLASYAVQCRIRRYATPGVQQVNINATNLKRVLVAVPSGPNGLDEQREIAAVLESQIAALKSAEASVEVLQLLKDGLVQDLYVGRVQVATGVGKSQERSRR